jgi:hypothetical protein
VFFKTVFKKFATAQHTSWRIYSQQNIILIIYATLRYNRRNQTINRKGAYRISRRPSHGQFERRCCPQAFLPIFSEVTYLMTVGNSTLLKIYALPNHTIPIGVCILETQLLGLLYDGGASFVQIWSMQWMAANRQVPFLYSMISMDITQVSKLSIEEIPVY